MTPDVRISAATLAGDAARPNQDRYVIERSHAGVLLAVIDGATTPGDARPDGGDYAEALAHQLTEGFRRGTADPRMLLMEAIQGAAEALSLPAASQPSAAAAVAFVGHEWTRVAVLGDCTVAMFPAVGAVEVVTDDRMARIADELRRTLDTASVPDQMKADLRAALIDEERGARNREGGYFIAADKPSAAWEADTRTVGTADLRGLALATDGAAAGPERYGIPGEWSTLLGADAPDVLDAVRQAEDSDPHRNRWPRSKSHDDATLVLATLRV